MRRQPPPSKELCLALNADRGLRDILGPRLIAVVRRREDLCQTFEMIGAEMGLTVGGAYAVYRAALERYRKYLLPPDPEALTGLSVRTLKCCKKLHIHTRTQLLHAALKPAEMLRQRSFGKKSYTEVRAWLGLPNAPADLFYVASNCVISTVAAKPIGIVKPGETERAVTLCTQLSATLRELLTVLEPRTALRDPLNP